MTIKKLMLVGLAVGVAAFASCSDPTFPTVSQIIPARTFLGATLTAAKEVPSVTATSTGDADVTVLDTNLIRLEVRVNNIDSVTQSHIHAGDAATAGPIMMWIFPSNGVAQNGLGSATNPVRYNGVLRLMDINRSTAFITPYNFDSVMTRIKNGTAYINVHTRKNPGGEIRGQIVPK